MVRSAKSNINLCLANRFRAIHPVRVKSPLCRAGRLFLHEETGDGACIDDEICELVSEQLRAAAVCSHKQMQDRLFVGALEIARRRAQTLGRIRTALESGDNATAVTLMRVYCGLDDEQESTSTPSRVN